MYDLKVASTLWLYLMNYISLSRFIYIMSRLFFLYETRVQTLLWLFCHIFLDNNSLNHS